MFFLGLGEITIQSLEWPLFHMPLIPGKCMFSHNISLSGRLREVYINEVKAVMTAWWLNWSAIVHEGIAFSLMCDRFGASHVY